MRGIFKRLKNRIFGRQERSSESKILEMMQGLPDGIFCVDRDWRLLYLNQKAEEIAGRQAQELVGRILWEEYPELIGTFIYAQYMVAMNERKMIRFEGYLPQFDSWFETSLYPKTEGLFIYFRDVSEVRKQRRAVNEFAQRAEASYRELEEMMYLVSHDLREPLRMISIFLELLKERSSSNRDEESDEFIAYLENAASDMKNRINDLMAYSQSSDLGDPQTNIDPKKVLSELKSQVKDQIFDRNFSIEIGDLPEIFGAEKKIRNLFEILLNNSIKFSKPNQDISIKVHSRLEPESLTIYWEDQGIGVDERYHNRIFQIFQRLAPKNKHSGAGLGLALARKIVQFHGGQIKLMPSQDSGAIFEISFPLHGELIKQRKNIFRLVS